MSKFFQKLALLWIACAAFTGADTFAMPEDADALTSKTLVIGCQPWERRGLETIALGQAHFIDFQNAGQIPVGGTTFHHFDLNDENTYGAPNFSNFAALNPGNFDTIIIDWGTFHHFRRESAWTGLANLLKAGGRLIVPIVQSITLMVTQQKAEDLKQRLTPLFSSVEATQDKIRLNEPGFEILRREGVSTCFLSETQSPIIIFATK